MGSSLTIQNVCLLLLLLVCIIRVHGQNKVFNVMNYGAVADGTTNNTEAFLKAWNEACGWNGASEVVVPSGSYMLYPVLFVGKCNGPIVFQLQGNLKGPTDSASLDPDQHWITFRSVEGLTVTGGGSFDGQGALTWACKRRGECKHFSASMGLEYVSNSRVENIRSINSKNVHFHIFSSESVTFENVAISAPADSPNTDGIHIGVSSNIEISNSVIATGDDCISVTEGSQNINVSYVHCGPGHGFSVGSLGQNQGEKPVIGFHVRQCNISGTENGMRIKTWPNPLGTGLVSDVSFEGIILKDVSNPIIIDQHYCPGGSCGQEGPSSVQIRDVKFTNIQGTSMSQIAVNLQCSSSFPCQNIDFTDINIIYVGSSGPATSRCTYVDGVYSAGLQNPPCCPK